jgi:hypothetical protein
MSWLHDDTKDSLCEERDMYYIDLLHGGNGIKMDLKKR